jgi:hypothetical protein
MQANTSANGSNQMHKQARMPSKQKASKQADKRMQAIKLIIMLISKQSKCISKKCIIS